LRFPSDRQLELFAQTTAKDSANVVFTKHARQRHINDPMVLEVLRMGRFSFAPEPDMTQSGLICRLQRFVAGKEVAVVVAVEYPETDLVVVTVIDVGRG
jgi:hypothetical protein